MIDKNSKLPIYCQIEDYIKAQIKSKEFDVDTMIPSERELIEMLNVSRHTIRQAIGNLVNEGYLYRLAGKGTFVKDRHLIYKENKYTSFTEDMEQLGKKLFSKVLSFDIVNASESLSNTLSVNENDPVIRVSRVRIADNVPLSYEIFYISKELVGDMDKSVLEGSLIDYYEKVLKLKLDHSFETIESIAADQKTSEILETNINAPLLLIRSKLYMENGKQLHYVKNYFRGDQYRVNIRLKR
ncbi:MAG TPA: GntR family transcriptional regulator [Patescibacteria group bacterium]|jgi:GntR family transcriptional regulator|nr:GntR family transcriptional regulator [Clostridia bacterium]HYE12405.1 GntR family transcriptional regulator [Patescibacteria group bacterium]